MALAMEAAKLVTAGWLAARWEVTSSIWCGVLIALVAGLAVINAAGVFSQLAAAHVGERGAAVAGLETQDASERREADLGPVKYLAALFGQADEVALHWFILVVALLLHPAAVLLLLAATRTR